MLAQKAWLTVTLVTTLFALSACGGGGGGNGGSTPPPPPPPGATFTLSGSVSGLSGSGLILQSNGGGDLAVSASGTFSFPTAVTSGTAYNVTVKVQPTNPSQTCTGTNSQGTANANVSNIAFTCTTNTYTVGGTISGLIGSGLVLQNNGSADLAATADGAFVLPTAVPSGGSYNVTVLTQPGNPPQSCTVSNGAGTITSSNIAAVVVACGAPTFTIGGTLTGLLGSGLVLQNQDGDDLVVSADGAFTFATPLVSGGNYEITVLKQPVDPLQSCSVSDASGTVANASITAPTIACTTQYARFANVPNSSDNTLSIYAVDAETGHLRARGYATTGTRPTAVAIDPSGSFVYVANQNAGTISAYTINATTTAGLTPVAGGPVAAGGNPNSVSVHPNGRFVYVATRARTTSTPTRSMRLPER